MNTEKFTPEEQIRLAIDAKRLCIRQINELLAKGEITLDIVEAYRQIRLLENDILRLQGIWLPEDDE